MKAIVRAQSLSSSLLISGSLHLSIVLVLFLIVWWSSRMPGGLTNNVDLDVFQVPKPSSTAVPLTIKEPPKPKPPAQESVFGVSRKAITSSEPASGVEVKKGNTVAKEQDNKILKAEDADQIPIPTDEFLVTAMPRMKRDLKVPYPDEAKKAGIEGPVMMDLLIDAQGKVRRVDLVRGPGGGLNEAAMNAAYEMEFYPAQVKEEAVPVKIRYTYRFILNTK